MYSIKRSGRGRTGTGWKDKPKRFWRRGLVTFLADLREIGETWYFGGRKTCDENSKEAK
jgi:hypothetical protein